MENRPKKQKGFQLPLEVIEWLEAEELKTGASLSRIALAAFCAYLLADPANRPNIMRMAMAVERGQVDFLRVRSADIELSMLAVSHSLKNTTNKEHRRALKRQLEALKGELRKVEKEESAPS